MPNTKVPEILAASITFIVVGAILVGLRLFTRLHVTKAYGWDDTFIVLSYLCFIASQVFIYLGCFEGLGKHVIDCTVDELVNAIKISYMIYAFVAGFVRASIGIAILRIVTARRYKYTIWAALLLNTVSILVSLIYTITECRPVSFVWDRFNPAMATSGGYCIPAITLTYLTRGTSASGIVLDSIFVIVPCLVIWNLQLEKRLKFIAMSTMSLGVFATLAIIIRLRYLIQFTNTADYSYAISDIAIWCIVECGLASAGACIMTFRPLMRHFNISISVFHGSSRGAGPSNLSVPGESVRIPDWPSSSKSQVKSKYSTRSDIETLGDKYGSEEEIYGTRGAGITMTQEFDVTESKRADTRSQRGSRHML